jgi:hypothetical protein
MKYHARVRLVNVGTLTSMIDSVSSLSTRVGMADINLRLRCPVMNVIGDHSPHDDDAVETNGRLNPAESTFLKVFLLFFLIFITEVKFYGVNLFQSLIF